MIKLKDWNPTYFLQEFKGSVYNGEFPTVPEMFIISTRRFPDKPCFTDFEGPNGSRRTLTYAEALQKIQTLAQWMAAHGLSHGDRVAVTGKNSPEWAVVYLAALFAGGIICPIDYALHEEEIVNLLNTAQPRFLFVDVEKYDWFASRQSPYDVYSLSPRQNERYAYNLSSEQTNAIVPCTEKETAAILFTSGTTGIPKGVMLSHFNLISDAFAAQTRMILYSTDVFYALLPIHHAYTMLAVFIETISVGAEVVFGKSLAATRMLKELGEGHITMLLGVPLLFNKLCAGILKGIREKGIVVYGLMRFLMNLSYIIKKVFKVNVGKVLFRPVLKKANLLTIRVAICGGGPLAPSIFKIYNELGIDFVQGYGLTETSPIIALNPVEHFKIHSVGQYFEQYSQMRIDNPNEDGIGEICVKGTMVMQGYFNMPEETAKVIDADGWLHTGDLGWLDNENYLMLSGRAKNMIVTEGGKNVYPEEIEDAFQLETDIEQIVVQGYIADKALRSEELQALIYPSDDMLASVKVSREEAPSNLAVAERLSAIVGKVNKQLLPYQRISKITVLEKPLEMTTTKKVKRTYTNA
ncbi:MAG: AMP-binding protein [Treponema sp.]|nr:AMP-binding protein [Treponema sp.]